MPKMLILTGPQGAGNHLWSKVFSLHPAIYGWKTLLDNYWEAHRFAEPFCNHWRDNSLLAEFDWSQSDYYFTSISLPLGIHGSDANPIWMPDIAGFVAAVDQCGVDVQVAVCGRDQSILEHQQTRIRHNRTFPLFMDELPKIRNPLFLSYELLYLDQGQYLNSLDVNIPVAWNSPAIHEILKLDSNAKYIHYLDDYILDNCNATGITLTELPK